MLFATKTHGFSSKSAGRGRSAPLHRTPLALALTLLVLAPAPPALAKKKAVGVQAAFVKDNAATVLDRAERAVEKAPRDAALRATLGRAYLKEGRFGSAATALADAVALGDGSSRTLLALSLAQIGSGQNREALQTLDAGRNSIPAADLGLALALAGEASRGTTILGDALRNGDKSDKLRANLAYAYALDGRWAEARNLVSLDLPADQVDQRMTEWAKAAAPEASRERVASLLGVPLRADSGLPQSLALAPVAESGAHWASHNGATAEIPALAAAPEPAPVPSTELPATSGEVATPAPVQWANVEPAHTVEAAPVEQTAPKAPLFHALAVKGAKPLKRAKVKFSKPAAKTADGDLAEAPVEMAHSAEPSPAKAKVKAAAKGHHAVQLGAFLSEKNAEKARKMAMGRDKSFAGDAVIITKAEVEGKTFWRVSVAGLDAATASGKCGAIRKSGGACFARSDAAPKAQTKATPRLAMQKPKAIALVATVKAH